jgi:hypothetical protein
LPSPTNYLLSSRRRDCSGEGGGNNSLQRGETCSCGQLRSVLAGAPAKLQREPHLLLWDAEGTAASAPPWMTSSFCRHSMTVFGYLQRGHQHMLKTTKTHTQDEAEILVIGHQGTSWHSVPGRGLARSLSPSLTIRL